jgi:penicillin-binding protein 1A
MEKDQSIGDSPRKSHMSTVLCVLWTFVFLLLAMAGVAVYGISQGWLGQLPPVSELENPINKYASRIYTADNQLLGTWSYASENRVMVSYDSLPQNLVDALIATEDERFYGHSGIDMRAFLRAVVKRGLLKQKSAGGGSTITQQLAKQLFSDVARDERKRLLQKPIEWFVAVQLERFYTKEEILTMYLNYFDFLNNAVGIKNAAKTYFGRDRVQDLTLNECATLVGMCKNPSYYNPRRFNERSRERRNVVLAQMHKRGYISEADMQKAQAEPLDISHFHVQDYKEGSAPYFREYLRRILMAKKPERDNYASWQYQQFYDDSLLWATDPLFGWCNKNLKKDGSHYNIYTDGLKIYTTLDSRMQQYAEQATAEHVAGYLQTAFDNEQKGNPTAPYWDLSRTEIDKILRRAMRQSERYVMMKKGGATDEEIERAFNTKIPMTLYGKEGKEVEMSPLDSIRYYKHFLRTAMMAMDPHTGQVKAYVGGLNYKYFQYDNVLGGGRRQIGSTMKPFLYTLAMENGFTPCDVAPNVQRTYGSGPTAWTPRNASHSRYGEMVTLKWGLSQSNNWIAAYVMAQLSPNALIDLLHLFGITNQNIYPSLPLCLGPCDVSVGEMVSAYTAFANNGVRFAPLLVTRIEDADGNVVDTFTPRMNEVMSQESCYKMIDMLRAVINSGTGVSLRSSRYNITADMIGKTGTTNSNADGWFMGVTPNLVVGCWVGGEDRDIHFRSMAFGQGARAALPIYGKFINKVYDNPKLGITQKDTFNIPADFQMCSSELDGLNYAPNEPNTDTGNAESKLDKDFR